jgi:hypothetical protein
MFNELDLEKREKEKDIKEGRIKCRKCSGGRIKVVHRFNDDLEHRRSGRVFSLELECLDCEQTAA